MSMNDLSVLKRRASLAKATFAIGAAFVCWGAVGNPAESRAAVYILLPRQSDMRGTHNGTRGSNLRLR